MRSNVFFSMLTHSALCCDPLSLSLGTAATYKDNSCRKWMTFSSYNTKGEKVSLLSYYHCYTGHNVVCAQVLAWSQWCTRDMWTLTNGTVLVYFFRECPKHWEQHKMKIFRFDGTATVCYPDVNNWGETAPGIKKNTTCPSEECSSFTLCHQHSFRGALTWDGTANIPVTPQDLSLDPRLCQE